MVILSVQRFRFHPRKLILIFILFLFIFVPPKMWGEIFVPAEIGTVVGGDHLRRETSVGEPGRLGAVADARQVQPAVAQGFYPDSISTDIHQGSVTGAMMDMQTTMSKFLAMGMPLDEVIKASTWNPAQQISREELGHLTPAEPCSSPSK